MLFLIDINQVMLISDADADFDWSLDALRLVQNQLILIDHGTDAAPQGSQILPKKYWLRRLGGIKKGFDNIRARWGRMFWGLWVIFGIIHFKIARA